MFLLCYEDTSNLQSQDKWRRFSTEEDALEWAENNRKSIQGRVYLFKEDHDLLEKERTATAVYNEFCDIYGLKERQLGNTFVRDDGKKFILTGIMPRNRKYKIGLKATDTGNRYKVTPDYFKRKFSEA